MSIRPYVPKRLKKSQATVVNLVTDNSNACNESLATDFTEQEQSNRLPQNAAFIDVQPDLEKVGEYSSEEKSLISKNFVPKTCLNKATAHKNAVNCVRWSSSSSQSLLLSASMDSRIGIWSFYKGTSNLVREIRSHEGAVKDARWNKSGGKILSGGYDKHARITDAETGKQMTCYNHKDFVTSVLFHPASENIFLGGTSNSGIFAWDIRAEKQIHHYKSYFGQVQDMLFHPDGKTFFSAAEILKRNSLDKAIIAWDFESTAVLSNQISQEAFGCTCLQNHPKDPVFLAQYGSGYTTIFSNTSPYKLDKYKRFEGHQTAGFRIGFTISPDGSYVITGDRNGKIHVYDYKTSRLIRTLDAFSSACMDVDFHPTWPSVLAACSWDGDVSFWQ